MNAKSANVSFGYWLKRYRKALDLTQAELGRRVGCTAGAIRKIEADERKPSSQLALLLADRLNVPPGQREVFLKLARHILPDETLVPELQPVLEAGAAPARETPRPAKHNLPTPITSLVDRTREIAAVTRYLLDDSVRLLTLVGPPGIGKTRLSLRCGQEVRENFPDGVWFVDLSLLQEASSVLPAIGRTLSFSEEVPAHDLVRWIRRILHDKRILIILDNFEHVVEGAASDLAEILKACRDVKVLVTSRVPLHIYGEQEYPVPALSLPPGGVKISPEALARYEAVQLFVIRVHQHTPDFLVTSENTPLIIELCRRMEGIPLALELAAATARWMTLNEMVEIIRPSSGQSWLRLIRSPARDLPPRQATLYGAIAWSYSLLDTREQAAFRCFGVFSGSFDSQAAAAVCGSGFQNQKGGILLCLQMLAERYLLSFEQGSAQHRWRMLEIVREYALESLAESGELQEAQHRHAVYFDEKLAGLNRIATHQEYGVFSQANSANLFAALDWAIQASDTSLALSLSSSIAWMCERLGFHQEGLARIQKALALPGEVEAGLRVWALFGASNLAWQLQKNQQSLAWMQAAADIARTNRLPLSDLLPMLNGLGRIYIQQGRYDRAREVLQECLNSAREAPEFLNPGRPLSQLGLIALIESRWEEARSQLSTALDLLLKEDVLFRAVTAIFLAEVALAVGDLHFATKMLRQAFIQARSFPLALYSFYVTLSGLLILYSRIQEDSVRGAVQLLGISESLANRIGIELNPWYQERKQERLELTRRILPRQEWEEAWNIGYDLSREEGESLAESLLRQIL